MAKKPSNQGKPWTSKDVSELDTLAADALVIASADPLFGSRAEQLDPVVPRTTDMGFAFQASSAMR
jgi:hypothetical protein